MPARWLDELNPQQREAAVHPGGPLLVIAGAGSGKTRTLACRVAWLIEQGVSPERILLLTFTRRAAAEMLARAGKISGGSATGRVWGGTFHAIANRLLRLYGRSLGLSPEFTVMDQADTADLMNLIRGELGLDESKHRFPKKGTLAAVYSRAVNSRTRITELVERYYPWCRGSLEGMRRIFEEYTRRKRAQQVLDYDDLLLFWNALCGSTQTAALVAERFEHVLVDEYQDTNLIQAEILQGLCRAMAAGRAGGGPPNVMVVGDDAQSIYSFRAATVRNILDFPSQFAGTKVVALEQNYRSTQPLLDASNAVMSFAKERFTKNLFSERVSQQKPILFTCVDEAEQCAEVCTQVLRKREEGTELRAQAVLFRAGHHSDQLEVELTRRNIPFVKYGGLKFVEAAHVKDLLAILRVLENPSDEMSWFRVLQLLEGVGPATARRIITGLGVSPAGGGDGAGEEPAASVPDPQPERETPPVGAAPSPLQQLVHSPPEVPAAAREGFRAFCDAVRDCIARVPGTSPGSSELPPAAQIERIRRFYEPLFERLYDNPVVRLRDLDQLELIAGGYSSRGQFLMDLTLDPPNSTQDLAGPPLLDEDYLILSTIHSAKGCEWDVVHIIHVADGMIPSDMSTGSQDEIEEERRLLYVAMTRARDALHMYFPLRYYHHGRGFTDRHSYGQVSRFLPDPVLSLVERRLGGSQAVQAAPESQEVAAAGTTAAVDAMLSGLWDP
jgi:DNA helicase-2/ATP-dependent DNA helicase PcrA